jgi:drug/metabolite transporter (DMT)-like permease
LGIFPSILAYLCWNNGVAVVGPSTSATFVYLLPIFAALLAFMFLGEKIYHYHLLGGSLIFIGLYPANRKGVEKD